MNPTEKQVISEKQVIKASVAGNGLPTCVTCKYWDDGVCRGGVPEVGPEGVGVWPRTKATDACGLWRNAVAQVGSGAEAKIPLKDVLSFLKGSCDECTIGGEVTPAAAYPRYELVQWMTEQGVSKSAAVMRLQGMARKGLIGMGYDCPAEYPKPKNHDDKKTIFVWPVTLAAGCDQPNEDRLLARMREIAPAGGEGLGVRAIWRASSDLGLSLGTIHRLLGVLFVNGLVERVGKDWRWVGTETKVEEVEA